MMEYKSIHPESGIGAVALRVRSLPRSVAFYSNNLGFSLLQSNGREARLGVGDDHLLTLRGEAVHRSATHATGLYHFAILVPSRAELAKSLRQLIDTETPLQGFADHLVSEAIYLADPDGNGIEIYRDRPRAQWPYRDEQLQMATDPLDVNGLLNEASDSEAEWNGLAAGTTIGHIHLQVSNLNEAVTFYRQTLGFDLVLRYGPSAAFLSAGGYHHHVGLNTWAGTGLPPAPDDAAGLIWYTIDLPDKYSFEEQTERLATAGLVLEERPDGRLVRDPSGIGILLRAVV